MNDKDEDLDSSNDYSKYFGCVEKSLKEGLELIRFRRAIIEANINFENKDE